MPPSIPPDFLSTTFTNISAHLHHPLAANQKHSLYHLPNLFFLMFNVNATMASSNPQNLFMQIFTKSTPPLNFSPLITNSISNSQNTKKNYLKIETLPFSVMSKRMLIVSMGALLITDPSSKSSKAIAEVLELERYTDSTEGFTLLRPSSWTKVDKAGATVLFQDVNNKGSNNVGVVVSPVRISKLSEFGNPEYVAEKLIEAEKRKESTKGAEVVGVAERTGEEGLQVYEFEYKLHSTRGGMKRVFSAAFVASKKLYLLNISHSDSLENPLDSDRRSMLEQVLHSFDVSVSQMA